MSITARFYLQRGEFELDAQFEIPAQGVTAVFGPSGCGKTSLLRAIAGLDCNKGGYLRVGEDIWQDSESFMKPYQRRVGYVFQEASLFPHLNVRANLAYGYARIPPQYRQLDFNEVTEWLGISHLLQRRTPGLSGGERQRIAIARALLSSPLLLLMDEPLSALDQASKAEILPFLESIHDRLAVPILYVSHAVDEVARLADHVLLMENGRVQAEGPASTMLTRLDLSLAHGNEAEAIIEATVTAHDAAYHLTYLDFAGSQLSVTLRDLPIGKKVRLRILARDVSITLKKQSDTSILNIFPAQVAAISDEGPARQVLRLETPAGSILSQITRKSASVLKLETGKQIYAQVKSVAMLG